MIELNTAIKLMFVAFALGAVWATLSGAVALWFLDDYRKRNR